jgi:hypothetical protein
MTETARAEPDPFEDDDAILATIEPANQPGVARGAMPHGASPLPLYDEAEFAALPEVSWLVEGVLPMSATTLFYGKRGSFKSFIALDLACSVSTGMSWQGREVVPGFVVYVAAEGRAGLIPRLAAWRSHREVSKTGMLLHPEALSLLAPENAARLVTSLQSRLPEGAELAPLLVVFDTLHR